MQDRYSASDYVGSPSGNSGRSAGNGRSRGSNRYQGGGRSYSRSSSDSGGDDWAGKTVKVSGTLEILPDYGVLRATEKTDPDLPKDVYIAQSQMRRFGLRMGDVVEGVARPPKEGERYLSLLEVKKVDGLDPEKARNRPSFEKLTPIFPDEWLKLEHKGGSLTARIVDLISPIGKGQRGLIVSPPYAGKTWVLKDIANGIAANHKKISVFILLVGERPEEVTDMQRSVSGEVVASNFDEPAENHARVAEMTLERAKRLSEKGDDVVVLMDSMTRLARAYNMLVPPSGRTLTGGFDPVALYPPKHFFGAARNFDGNETGSLTIISTALVDTGSRMDDVIYEEFKGTGNMELHLDRSLAERRVFPAINIKRSNTRREDLLYGKEKMEQIYKLRRMVDLLDEREATQAVVERLKKTKDNEEFLKTLHESK